MNDFAGLVSLVTGGASGIGAAVTSRLAGLGASVAVLDRSISDTDTDERDGVLYVTCDVTDQDSVERAVEKVAERWGRLDVVVNSAGVGAQGDVSAIDPDEFHRVMDVNVMGIIRVSAAALPGLRRSPHAAIVNIGSIAGHAGLPRRALYSASKGAVHALTLAMAADHLVDGIRVNAVAPGTADTPWVQRLLEASPDAAAERTALNARQPHGRLVTAEEVAGAVAYLVSPGSGSTTGTIVAVDGGMATLQPPARR